MTPICNNKIVFSKLIAEIAQWHSETTKLAQLIQKQKQKV